MSTRRTPAIKVYDADGVYQAAVKEWEAGAALLGALYQGGTLRYGHARIIYTDGVDGDAGLSFDDVVEICLERMPL